MLLVAGAGAGGQELMKQCGSDLLPRGWSLVTCLVGPTGDRQELCEALAAVLGHCQYKAAMCF